MSEDRDAEIVRLAKAGWSTPAIAEELGVGARTVQRVRKAANVEETLGRPATGRLERIESGVDEETLAVLDARAAEAGTTRAEIIREVLTAWARRIRVKQG